MTSVSIGQQQQETQSARMYWCYRDKKIGIWKLKMLPIKLGEIERLEILEIPILVFPYICGPCYNDDLISHPL